MKDTNQLTEGLSVLWHALHCYREDSIPEGIEESWDEEWDENLHGHGSPVMRH